MTTALAFAVLPKSAVLPATATAASSTRTMMAVLAATALPFAASTALRLSLGVPTLVWSAAVTSGLFGAGCGRRLGGCARIFLTGGK
jgi:hypothetical protein